MAHAKAVNRKKNWDDDDPEGAASGVNTPITGNISFAFKILKSRHYFFLILSSMCMIMQN